MPFTGAGQQPRLFHKKAEDMQMRKYEKEVLQE